MSGEGKVEQMDTGSTTAPADQPGASAQVPEMGKIRLTPDILKQLLAELVVDDITDQQLKDWIDTLAADLFTTNKGIALITESKWNDYKNIPEAVKITLKKWASPPAAQGVGRQAVEDIIVDVDSSKFAEYVLHPEDEKVTQEKLFADFASLKLVNLFPLSTKHSPDAAPGVNFLFGTYNVGSVVEAQLKAMSSLQLADSLGTYRIYFLRGISGAGKTHFPMAIAKRGMQFVFIVNSGKRGALRIPADLEVLQTPTINGLKAPWEKGFQAHQHKQQQDIWDMYWELEARARHYILRIVVAHLLFLRSAVRNHPQLTPLELCRMLDDGGLVDIKELVGKLTSYTYEGLLKALPTLVNDILKVTGKNVLFAFDEAQDLLRVFDNCIPFGTRRDQINGYPDPLSGQQYTTKISTTGHLENGSCALSAVIHVMCDCALFPSIFFGTALRMLDVMQRTSAFRRQRAFCIDEMAPLKRWEAKEITDFIQHYLNWHPDLIRMISPLLEGRARITTTFLTNLFIVATEKKYSEPKDMVSFALHKALQEITEIILEEYDSLNLTVSVDGVPMSKASVFRKLLLYGDEIKFSASERDVVSQTILFLEDGCGREPMIVEAMRRVLSIKRISAFGLVVEQGLDILKAGGPTSSIKGPWSELAFAHILLDIASELNGKPITAHPLFQQLQGTPFDHYTLCVKNLCFGPDTWYKCLKEKDTKHVLLQLDVLLRWDLCAILVPLSPATGNALLTMDAKLCQQISLDDFCDNILASIPSRGFITGLTQILNREKRQRLLEILGLYADTPNLCISFLYGGFPPDSKPSYAWKDGNNYFLIIDRSNTGLQKLLSKSLRETFDQFVGAPYALKNQYEPWELIALRIGKLKSIEAAEQNVMEKLTAGTSVDDQEWKVVEWLKLAQLQSVFKTKYPEMKIGGKRKAELLEELRTQHHV